MDAIEYIKDNLNGRTILEYYNFNNIVENEETIRACCKLHDGDNKTAFVWNKTNNLWNCFTKCGGGNAFTLIQRLEDCSFIESVHILANILELDIEGMEINVNTNKLKQEQKKWLAEKRKKNTLQEYKCPNIEYFKTNDSFKRFNEETLKHFNAVFCKEYPLENYTLKDKLVIPIFYLNSLVGVALRDLAGNLPKWMYQPKGLKLSQILYDFKDIKKEVIVCEGIFDVWAFYNIGIKATCVFGSNISKEQQKLLLKTNLPITLCFDGDEAGNKATESSIPLFKYKTNLKVINLPKGKDPADCTKTELINAYMKRKEII